MVLMGARMCRLFRHRMGFFLLTVLAVGNACPVRDITRGRR